MSAAAAKVAPALLRLLKGAKVGGKLALKSAKARPFKTALTVGGGIAGGLGTISLADQLLGYAGVDLSGEQGRMAQMVGLQGQGALLDDLDTSYDLLREEEIARATRPFLGVDGDPFAEMPVVGAREASSQSQFQAALVARQGELARLSVVDQGDTSFEELALRMGI